MGSKPRNTDEYLESLPDEKRTIVEELRRTIHSAAPQAEESFSYGMPGYRLGGRALVWYAAWKHHYSIYPIGPELALAHGIDVKGYTMSRGTIRFPASERIPHALVRRLVKARVTQLSGTEGRARVRETGPEPSAS